MSLENSQLIDNEPIDNSIIKKDFLKMCHQPGSNLNVSDQNVACIFGENKNYHQIGNGYFEFDITVRSPAANFDNISETRLLNIASAYCFKDAFFINDGWLRPRT